MKEELKGRRENVLNESIGSRISSTFNPWNLMNAGIPLADSGWSCLIPCLIERDLRRRRARTTQRT
jgi:hypothetical protein